MIDHVVIDVEIQKRIQDVPGGWDATDQLGVACAVLYEYRSDRFRVYGPDDVEALKDRLTAAEKISGFNIWRFDYPVIWGLPSRQRVAHLQARTNDLLVRVWRALGLDEEQFSDLHKGWGLDAICKGTFGRGKTGYGGDAPVWFQQGNWARLVDYCIDDVKLERDLTDFIDRYGYVVNGNTGQVVRLDSAAVASRI